MPGPEETLTTDELIAHAERLHVENMKRTREAIAAAHVEGKTAAFEAAAFFVSEHWNWGRQWVVAELRAKAKEPTP